MSLSSLQGLTLKPLSGKNFILLSKAHFINISFFMGKHVKRLKPNHFPLHGLFYMFSYFPRKVLYFTKSYNCNSKYEPLLSRPIRLGLLDYSLRYHKKYLVLTLVWCFIQHLFFFSNILFATTKPVGQELIHKPSNLWGTEVSDQHTKLMGFWVILK